MQYIIALGSNLIAPNFSSKEEQLERAIELINERCGEVSAQSTLYETEPVNHPDTPDLEQPVYLNGVILLESELPPAALLEQLLSIEREIGRDRSTAIRWTPRVIDLDIIAAENQIISTPALIVPHPEMHKRRFVLEPMMEVAPEWRHPLIERTTRELFQTMKSTVGE